MKKKIISKTEKQQYVRVGRQIQVTLWQSPELVPGSIWTICKTPKGETKVNGQQGVWVEVGEGKQFAWFFGFVPYIIKSEIPVMIRTKELVLKRKPK